ncbi:MAG: hypothetical protein K6C36_07310 [Clostridia bacterium]|nr:hypothetical protein [Clostridia bacterium]
MKHIDPKLFYLIQWTWGFPINFAGAVLYVLFAILGCRHEDFGYARITYVPWNAGGVSLGTFIFMKKDHPSADWTYDTKIHEYGHTWQCLVLGPLFWFIIALPSFIWCNCFDGWRKKHKVSYFTFYPEKWANAWGQKYSGMRMRHPK